MGLWDWVIDALVGRGGGPPVPTGVAGGEKFPASDGAVAVLEEADVGSSESDGEDEAARWWEPVGEVLTEPAAVAAPELSPEARALENILIAQFDGHELDLPPMPLVAERVIRALGNANYDVAELSRDLAEDQVIAASVVRMANSVLYAGVEKITSLRPAVNRLGANALRTLMMHQSLRAVAIQRKGCDVELANILWQRSLASACIMRGLSRFTGMDGEEAFLIGLLHDIGGVIVLREVQKQQSVLHYKVDVDTFEYFCDECHQELGELIADAWNLPAKLKALIRDHHDYPDRDDPLRTERLTIQLSHMINAMIGFGVDAPYRLLETRPVIDLGLDNRADFPAFLLDLPDLIESNVTALSF